MGVVDANYNSNHNDNKKNDYWIMTGIIMNNLTKIS